MQVQGFWPSFLPTAGKRRGKKRLATLHCDYKTQAFLSDYASRVLAGHWLVIALSSKEFDPHASGTLAKQINCQSQVSVVFATNPKRILQIVVREVPCTQHDAAVTQIITMSCNRHRQIGIVIRKDGAVRRKACMATEADQGRSL